MQYPEIRKKCKAMKPLLQPKQPTNPDASFYNYQLDIMLESSVCTFNVPQKQEKEDTMTCTYNETEATRKYLTKRVADTTYSLRIALEKQFNLHKLNTPISYKEMIDAIKNGQYTLDPKMTARIDNIVEADGHYYGSFLDGIVWKFPDAPDYDGYRIADKALEKAKTAALDTINTADAATGLKAVQDFEGWTYTAPTTTAVQ